MNERLFTDTLPERIAEKEVELRARGYRLVPASDGQIPGPKEYTKAQASGSEYSFGGVPRTTLRWFE